MILAVLWYCHIQGVTDSASTKDCFCLLFASILNYVLIFFISALCTVIISIVITGSSHIDTVCVIRWKFIKWRKNDDNNTDWSWSIRPSHQWYSGVISIQLESHFRNMSISLPFFLIQHNFMYLWVPHLAPRKFTHDIWIAIFEMQIQFLFSKRCIELFLMKRRCGQSVVCVRCYDPGDCIHPMQHSTDHIGADGTEGMLE